MKSLVAVRQANRDQRPGPRAHGGQLVHVGGFSRGWPGQPGLKPPPYIYPSSSQHLAIWSHSLHKLHKWVLGLLLVPLMHIRCLMKCPKSMKQT